MPSPAMLIAALVALAVLSGAAGVFVLVGLGWTLVFLSAAFTLVAAVLARGLTRG